MSDHQQSIESPAPTNALEGRLPMTVLRLLAVAVSYYLTARLGLLIPYVGSHVSLVWLPTGIATAAYWRWGRVMAVAVSLAAFAVNYQIGGPIWMGIGIAAGNSAGPWLATLLLRRWAFDESLTRRRDLGLYLAAIMLGMVVTATNGTVWLWAAAVLPMAAWPGAWMTWWTGDAVGALLGGIPLIAVTPAIFRETFTGPRGGLNTALLAVVLACGLIGFSPWTAPSSVLFFPLLSLPLFVTAVLALRAGVFAASLAVLILSATAAWGTANGIGPFVGHDTHAGLLALWSYITAQACTSVLICGLAAQLLATRRQQAALFGRASEAILVVTPDGGLGELNPAAHEMFALAPHSFRGRRLAELPHGNGAALARWLASVDPSGSTLQHQYLQLVRADGTTLEVEAQIAHHHDARGQLQTQVMLRDVTERREAEEALRLSEERYRAVLEDQADVVCRFDAKGAVVYANEACRRLVGLPPGEFERARWQSVVVPEDLPAVMERLKAISPRHPVVVTEHRAMHAERGLCWMEFVNHAFYGADGQMREYQIVGRDVTHRKELEQQLAQTNARVQDLYDNAPCGYHSVDAQGKYVHVNAVELAWLGCTRDEVIGKLGTRDFLSEDSRGPYQDEFARLLAQEGYVGRLECDLVSRDGTVRRVSLAATSVRDDNGNFVMTRSVLHDVTEMHHIRSRLMHLGREQEAMLNTDLVGIAKARGRYFVWKNAAFERILGYGHDELLGKSTRQLYADEASYLEFGKAAYPAISTGRTFRTQMTLVRKDGSPIWIDMSGAPLDDGESVWLLQDITLLKQQQERMEQIAFHDALTGLPNRVLLSDRLRQMLALCERLQSQLAVCFVDLDGFKAVNDTFGHDAGDMLLKEVSRRLQGCVRANDTVARLGGDEFVLVLAPIQTKDECQPILARVQAALCEPVNLGSDRQGRVSASIGVAFYPSDGQAGGVLMARADEAMYAAKRSGRNRVKMWNAV